MKKILYCIVLATMFLQTGFLSGISVRAQGDATETPTLEPTNTPQPTATETASPTPEIPATPLPSETPSVVATETASPSPSATETPLPSATPTTTQPAPVVVEEITLSLSSNPTFLRRGGKLTLDWKMEGLGEIAKGMSLRFYLPKGVAVVDPKSGRLNETGETFDVEVVDFKGSIGFEVGMEVESPYSGTITRGKGVGQGGIATTRTERNHD